MPDTLGSRDGLAKALAVQGKRPQAEVERRAVLAAQQRALGAEHPDALASRNNLAAVLDDRRKFAEAEYRAVLAVRERELGAEHLDTLRSRWSLEIALVKLGRPEEANEVRKWKKEVPDK